jgi:monoamine oxidase
MPEIDVTIVEAKNRVGGRTLSGKLHGTIYDFGAMWVGPRHTEVIDLAARAKNDLIPQDADGIKILELNGNVSTYPSDIPNNINIIGLIQLQYVMWRINRMARTVPLKNPRNCPNGVYWDSITVYTWMHENIWFEKVKKLFEAAIRGVLFVEPSEISMLFFLWFVHQNTSVDNLINIPNANQ